MQNQKKQLTMDERKSLSLDELEHATGGGAGLVLATGDLLIPRWWRLGIPADRFKDLGNLAQGGNF